MKPAQLLHLRGRINAWRWQATRKHRQAPAQPPKYHGNVRRMLLLTCGDDICQSQIFPFHFYAKEIRRRHNIEIREIGIDAWLTSPTLAPKGIDIVAFQLWIDRSDEQFVEIATRIREWFPRARVAFLDPYAPTYLRYASILAPHVDLYVKKHLLRDRAFYQKPVSGDTNLTDYFGARYGFDLPMSCHAAPAGFFERQLVQGPSFATAAYMLPTFAALDRPPITRAPRFDLHARLGGVGDKDWYERLRQDAVRAVRALRGVRVTPDGRISRRQYLREMRDSTLCFSPFGYGEVCWRDFEAVHSGALLIKPDMSHLETSPDIFRAGVTYAPVRWDFADLGDVVDRLLRHPDERRTVATEAWSVVHAYARDARFVDEMHRLFGSDDD